MDIAALSMAMSQSNVQQQASLCVMKKTMDQTSAQTSFIQEMMPPAPSFGHRLDVRA